MNTPRALILVLAVSATLVLASTATPATAENKICPKLTGHTWHAFGKSGNKYSWEVIGTAFTCGNAKHWVLKLMSHPVHGTSGVKLKGGPSGYHCAGTMIDSKGYAYGGVCYQHTLAFPKNGFSWSPA